MAETLISPGVLARENDQSQITAGPIQAGAAIIGPTVKGQVEIPTLCTSYSDYVSKFGNTFTSGSEEYSYFTSISAYNYFQNGGTSLLVTRVANGTFTSATSSFISSSLADDVPVFELETLAQGTINNSLDGTYVAAGNASNTGSNGTLLSGSKDNLRWEITNPNTSSGVFSLVIRRGDDTKQQKTVLETFANVSLDPKASNYIARQVGDQSLNKAGSGTDLYLQTSGSFTNGSNFIRIKKVNKKTPDYLDNAGNAKTAFTASIPVAMSGGFGSAQGNIVSAGDNYYQHINNTDSQGLTGTNYTDAINLLANKDDFRYNLITTPGLLYSEATHATALNTLIANTENRGDNIIVLDLSVYNSSISAITTQASSLDTSYAAAYWPWLQVTEPDTRQLVWVPASTMIPVFTPLMIE